MPAPANVDELLDLVQKSGVADPARLKSYMQKLTEQKAVPTEPANLAGQFVRDGLLTYFQAEQILQGKWKRFSIGKYKVLERLGSGGMGQVFLCEHKLMKRRVAVKVLPTSKADDASSLGRFQREARAAAAVDHPNIVRAYDIDQDDNLHFLVMEFVDGTNLSDLVKKAGPLDPIRACHYVYGAAVGLQHAHEIGLVHRDIKPGNILVDRSGVVKVLDLGLARFFHDEVDNLTKQYDENVLGTADYLAPEQALDSHTVDIRADIYSLGATFYYLLTGSALFPEGSVAQKLIWHQSRKPRSVKELRPEVPDEMAAVLEKMMAKDPAARYQTPADVMAALDPWVVTPIPPPSERELPQLSPAASGPSTVTRNASALGGPPPRPVGQTLSEDAPTLPATAKSVRPAGPQPQAYPAPVAYPPPTSGPTGDEHWQVLDSDTQTDGLGDVTRGGLSGRSGRSGHAMRGAKSGDADRRAAPGGRSKRVVWLGLGLLLLAGAGVGVYFAFIKKPADTGGTASTDKTPPPTGPQRLVVKAGDPQYPTLAHALRKANPGDTIAIADEEITTGPIVLHAARSNLTIESGLPDGRPVTIAPPQGGSVQTILAVQSAKNVIVRNVVFDGRGAADTAVQVSGACANVLFQNVTVRGVKSAGFKLQNVTGEPNNRVTLDEVRVIAAPDVGVLVSDGGLDSQHVVVKNSRVEGPGKAGIRFDGAVNDIEVINNRVFKVDSGFVFGPLPPDDKSARVQVVGNTVYEAGTGVLFEPKNPPAKKYEVQITRNYFGKVAAAARGTAPGDLIPGVTGPANRLGPNAQPGNLKLNLTPGSPPPASLNPDDPNFLRVPGP